MADDAPLNADINELDPAATFGEFYAAKGATTQGKL